ncbi:MAG: ATP-binding cassette domain-containing protein [Planctomycetota bacterium]|nr:ATP-binding cassette domain-containing protein [Planctomycetota bacterium]
MAELELKGATISFGAGALLDHTSLTIEKGERVGLLGRNGAGKTTLMRVLMGDLELDEGSVILRPGLTVAMLEQDVPADAKGSVEALLRGVLGTLGIDEWEADKRVERELDRFDLDRDKDVAELSAGMKRRALLAKALVVEPDLLVLDEPTNHLELDAIARLEEALLRRRGSLLFVTHDRAFLRKVATRIIDLDRGNIVSYECGYGTYLERKADNLAAEAKQQAEFDKHLAKEEVWIRQGILARRTRNMGRVRALKALREERSERRKLVGTAKAKVQETERSGRLVLRTKGLSFAYGENRILDGFDFELLRGDRVGVVGPNGAGKSTLLSLLLGELEPESGEVRHGTKLEVARFDQLHGTLDERRTAAENVCGDGDVVFVDGHPRNVISYLSDFLFTPDQARSSIAKLSGGEKNRLQLAAILARPCNLLVLDEPTNDLDLETLELLEELLSNYKGTLLVVSHDREFLENVVTSIVARDPEPGAARGELGTWREHMGGYDDWQRDLRERKEAAAAAVAAEKAKAERKSAGTKGKDKTPRPRKLTFTEAHELAKLPDAIEALDAKKDALLARMSTPDFYKQPLEFQTGARAELERVESELDAVMERWEELESLER